MNNIDQAIIDQLGRASVAAKYNQYPIYEKSTWNQFKLPHNVQVEDTTMFLIDPRCKRYYEHYGSEDDIPYSIAGNPPTMPFLDYVAEKRRESLSNVRHLYVAVSHILRRYHGKVVLAGGALTNQFYPHDVDLYFINCSKVEMEEIYEDSYAMISEFYPPDFVWVESSEFLKNIVVPDMEDVFGPPLQRQLIYQFIMKSYDSIGELLGGFDLFASQVCYDGVNTWATDTGAWAYVNNIIVVDISRVSNKFRERLHKYGIKLFSVVIPGLKRFQTPTVLDIHEGMDPNTGYHEIIPGICLKGEDATKTKISLSSAKDDIKLIYAKPRNLPHTRLDINDYICGNMKMQPDQFYRGGQTLRRPCFIFPDEKVIHMLLMARKKKGNAFSDVPRDIINLIISKIPYV